EAAAGNTVVLAIDRETGLSSQRLSALRADRAGQGKRQIDVFGNTMDGQRSVSDVAVALLLHRLALESDLRKFRRVQEIRTAQIVVAVVIIRVDTRRLDRHIDGRLGRIFVVKGNRAAKVVKASVNRAHGQVLHGKANGRVDRIDFVFIGGPGWAANDKNNR